MLGYFQFWNVVSILPFFPFLSEQESLDGKDLLADGFAGTKSICFSKAVVSNGQEHCPFMITIRCLYTRFDFELQIFWRFHPFFY